MFGYRSGTIQGYAEMFAFQMCRTEKGMMMSPSALISRAKLLGEEMVKLEEGFKEDTKKYDTAVKELKDSFAIGGSFSYDSLADHAKRTFFNQISDLDQKFRMNGANHYIPPLVQKAK